MIIVALLQRQQMVERRSQGNQHLVQTGSEDFASSQDRVERYRQELGEKLNLDRIRVQHKNIADMRVGNVIKQGPDYDPVLTGVPLDGEKPFAIERKSPKYHDLSSEIRTRVEFEHKLEEWESEARAHYIEEFVANAKAMGYRVQIDADYNVYYESVEARMPQSFDLTLPSFVRAPMCQ